MITERTFDFKEEAFFIIFKGLSIVTNCNRPESVPLTENVLKPLAKSISVSLGLSAATPATDAAVHKNIFASGVTTLIISNEEINGIMKIVKLLEESGLLIKGVTEAIKNKAKEKKRGFLRILLGTLEASLLRNILTGKWTIKAGHDF